MADNVHEGDLDLSDVTSPEGLELPDKVTGNLDLWRLKSADGLNLPEHVGRYLWLDGLTSAEGLKLPEHVGGNLILKGLTSAEGLKLPEHVGGDLHLWSLDEDEYDQEVHGPGELGGKVYFSDPEEEEEGEEGDSPKYLEGYPGDLYCENEYWDNKPLLFKNFPNVFSGTDYSYEDLFRRFTQNEVDLVVQKIQSSGALIYLPFVWKILSGQTSPASYGVHSEGKFDLRNMKAPFWFIPFVVYGFDRGGVFYFEQNGLYANCEEPTELSPIAHCDTWSEIDVEAGYNGLLGFDDFTTDAGVLSSLRVDAEGGSLNVVETHGEDYASSLPIVEAIWKNAWKDVVDRSRDAGMFFLGPPPPEEFFDSWEELLDWAGSDDGVVSEAPGDSSESIAIVEVEGTETDGRGKEADGLDHERLIKSGDLDDILRAVSDPSCPSDLLDWLNSDHSIANYSWGVEEIHDIVRAMASNPNTPKEHLISLWRNQLYDDDRLSILRNPNCPKEILEGDLDLSKVTSPEGLELPDRVTGSLRLESLTSAEGLKLPEHVGGTLSLWSLTSAEGLKLPEHVGGTLSLEGLKSAEGLELPEHVGGELTLGQLTTADGLKLPKHVGGSLLLNALTSAEGLKLPEYVGGWLFLDRLTSAKGLKLPQHVGGNLYLSSSIQAEYDQEVHGPRELGGEVHFSDPNKKEEEAVEEPVDSVQVEAAAEEEVEDTASSVGAEQDTEEGTGSGAEEPVDSVEVEAAAEEEVEDTADGDGSAVESTSAESTSEDTSGLDLLEGAMQAAMQKAVDEGTAPPEMERALAGDVRFVRPGERPPLVEMVEGSASLEAVRALLDQEGTDVNACDSAGDRYAAIHYAAWDGKTEILRLLIDRGAEVSIMGSDGWQSIHLAAADGHTKAVEVLLLAGAEVDRRLPPADNPYDPVDGTTALRQAVLNHHWEIVDLLEAAEADLSILLEPCSGGSADFPVQEGQDFCEATTALAQSDPSAGRGFDPARLEALQSRAVSQASSNAPATDGLDVPVEVEAAAEEEEVEDTASSVGVEQDTEGETGSGAEESSATGSVIAAAEAGRVDEIQQQIALNYRDLREGVLAYLQNEGSPDPQTLWSLREAFFNHVVSVSEQHDSAVPVSVRLLLGLFGVKRRGSRVVKQVAEEFGRRGIEVLRGDLASSEFDDLLEIRHGATPAAATTKQQDDPEDSTEATGTVHDELSQEWLTHHPEAVVKKINRDTYLDIHMPEIHSGRGTHLFFNTARGGIRVGFFCRDAEFLISVVSRTEDVESYSSGLRPKGNPSFDSVSEAIATARAFVETLTG